MRQREHFLTHRRTILIASFVPAYAETVAALVARAGFAPAFPATMESPWITVARTQPCVVICDCNAPVLGIQRLADESSARRVPLVFSGIPDGVVDVRSLNHAARSVSIEQPVSDAVFCSILETLVRPMHDTAHRVRPAPPRLTIVAHSRRRIATWDTDFTSDDELAMARLAG